MHLPTLTTILLFLPQILAQPTTCIQGPHCTSCGWFCNQGCDTALLDSAECARCLYCRRESSACEFVDVSHTWTADPPSAELCEACARGCWCRGDWYCMDDGTGPPEAGSSRVKTGTGDGEGV
ncbi:uncharacterized protein F4807DRAFT_462641 [Annulohypoxylon truncatum]|uniref:uncharacterized protein n=1 Tax=Annulohypoxylon truncatum TaxID=327061 RepID=UPI002008E1B1|nr:uncharacterized protein F4807DRAFT_462641 [Annulohypoxylon truncatum]KAI1207489.1 hypothetical protein F4807DRAFT_462641 [Annulohypoxylon truncatum]